MEISNALFDAIPATEPLPYRTFRVPGTHRSSYRTRWWAVLETGTRTAQASGFYMLLSNGVQRITGFVADLLRTAGQPGVSAPQLVSPDKLVDIPQVEFPDVGFYPTARLEFIDTEANLVTCVGWQKQSTDRQATVSVVQGRGLPTPQAMDSHIVRLVRDNRDPESVEADQT